MQPNYVEQQHQRQGQQEHKQREGLAGASQHVERDHQHHREQEQLAVSCPLHHLNDSGIVLLGLLCLGGSKVEVHITLIAVDLVWTFISSSLSSVFPALPLLLILVVLPLCILVEGVDLLLVDGDGAHHEVVDGNQEKEESNASLTVLELTRASCVSHLKF